MKTSTAIFIVGGVGAVGVLGYMFWKNKQNSIPLIAGPGQPEGFVNPQLLTQPSQVYPSQYGSGQVVRQDTASEPWASAQTKAVNQVLPSNSLVDQNFAQNVAMAKGAADIVSSIGSIWDDLNLGSLWDNDGSYFEEDDSTEMNWDWSNIA